MSTEVDLRVDVCGTCCPVPLIELTRAANSLRPGQTLEIIGNDPVFETAVHNYCQSNGHAVLEVTTRDDQSVHFLIKVGGR